MGSLQRTTSVEEVLRTEISGFYCHNYKELRILGVGGFSVQFRCRVARVLFYSLTMDAQGSVWSVRQKID